ncbi:MAG: hypothetical protein Tsb002_16180 [Wenzhouxiangellaceae bacterium]
MNQSNVAAADERYQRIWRAVAAIPPGRVMSYGQVAQAAGLPRRARLVGRALRLAPDHLQLPWHRVVRSDGRLAFEPGSSTFRKQSERLASEGVAVVSGKVAVSDSASADDLDYVLWSPE